MENTIPSVSNEITYMPVEKIQAAYDANDMGVINGVLSGAIKSGEKPVETTVPEQVATNEPTEQVEEVIDYSIVAKRQEEDIEKAKRYIEEIEKKKKEEIELKDIEKIALLKQIDEERKRREEVEKRIKEMDAQKPKGDSVYSAEEDEELVSDYAKNTRKMIDDLKGQIGQTNTSDPKIHELEARLKKFEQEAERVKVEEDKTRKAKEAEERIFNEVKTFQSKYPELQTKKNFGEVATEFNKFKESLASFAKVTSSEEVDRVLMSYFDENKGKKLREEAAKIGIVAPDEAEKFVHIAELVDMTRGFEYDPILERFVQIKNSVGETVRYRSIEESYKVKNYYNEINNAKKKVAKQISTKLNTIQNSPVTIDNNETRPIENGLSNEQVGEIVRNAELYVTDRNRYELLKRAYAKLRAPAPEYRGK